MWQLGMFSKHFIFSTNLGIIIFSAVPLDGIFDWQVDCLFSNVSKNPPFAFKMQMNETRCMPETHVEKPTIQYRTHWHVIVFYVYSSLHTVFLFFPQK